jgi:hypothetical protein
MEGYSHADFNRLAAENAKLKNREAKEKSTAIEYSEKAIVGLSAGAVGFALGVYEAQNGATAESPALVGGTVPVDAVAAGLGLAAILATPVRGSGANLMPVSLGAGGAAIGVWAHRQGFAWQQARAGAAAPATTATSSGPGALGWSHGGMDQRFGAPGPGQYGTLHNPYVDALG